MTTEAQNAREIDRVLRRKGLIAAIEFAAKMFLKKSTYEIEDTAAVVINNDFRIEFDNGSSFNDVRVYCKQNEDWVWNCTMCHTGPGSFGYVIQTLFRHIEAQG